MAFVGHAAPRAASKRCLCVRPWQRGSWLTFNAFRSGGGKVPTLFGSRIGRGFEHEVTSRGARVAQVTVGRAVQPAGRGAVRSGSSRRKAVSICLSHSCSTSGQEFCARSARSSSGTRPRTRKEGPALGWPACCLPAAAPWRAFTHPVGGTCGGHRGDTVSESGLARPCTAASARPSPAAPRVEAGGGSHSGAGGARGGLRTVFRPRIWGQTAGGG